MTKKIIKTAALFVLLTILAGFAPDASAIGDEYDVVVAGGGISTQPLRVS